MYHSKMKICSEESCKLKAIKEIGIHAESYATDREYIIQVYVCKSHYESEKCENNIVNEKPVNTTRNSKRKGKNS